MAAPELFKPTPPHFMCSQAAPRKVTQTDILTPHANMGGNNRKKATSQLELVVMAEPDHWPKEAEDMFGPQPCRVGDRIIVTGLTGPFTINFQSVVMVHAQDILGVIRNFQLQVPMPVRPIGS